MSVYVFASLVIGYRFDRSDLVRMVTKPGCKHKIPNGSRFCPECGKPTAVPEEEELVPLWDNKCGDYNIQHGNYDMGDWVGDYYVIGDKVKGTWTDTDKVPESHKESLRQALEEMGVDVSTGTYGIHVVTYYG